MIANTNPDTGIRYGIVSLNSLHGDIFHDFVSNGTDLDCEAAYDEAKAEFIAKYHSDALKAAEIWEATRAWEDSGEQNFYDSWECDEASYEWETEGMKLGMSTLGGAYNVWVFESPHTAEHALCSPCCPNAGNIDTPGNYLCYTLPADWFRNEAQ